jgi:N-methylhydantoinase A/oxoprolinase/acetone carboxylase beta subunit
MRAAGSKDMDTTVQSSKFQNSPQSAVRSRSDGGGLSTRRYGDEWSARQVNAEGRGSRPGGTQRRKGGKDAKRFLTADLSMAGRINTKFEDDPPSLSLRRDRGRGRFVSAGWRSPGAGTAPELAAGTVALHALKCNALKCNLTGGRGVVSFFAPF